MITHRIDLTVNGKPVTADVEPRTQLVDLLREQLLLTGTHIGCEHGVCGACTVHIDGMPARSCITYAVNCQGASIRTIEDFEDDEIMQDLRSSFSREHALQCGYCTPGVLATARDIVLRLPEADTDRIRLELSGNLCRCTGYSGMVRAIDRTLRNRRQSPNAVRPERRALGPAGSGHPATLTKALQVASPEISEPSVSERPAKRSFSIPDIKPNFQMRHSFTVDAPRDQVWALFEDVHQVSACLPGAELSNVLDGDQMAGHVRIALGPIKATFKGVAQKNSDPATFSGVIRGRGDDANGGSSTSGELRYELVEENAGLTRVNIFIAAAIQGPLANFSRSKLIDELVKRLTTTFANNVIARLNGPLASEPHKANLNAGSLIFAALWARIKSAIGLGPK